MEKTEQSFQSQWKSLDEKYKTPEFLAQLEKEFQSSPLKEDADPQGLARRQFMKLMGASIALSSAACVRRPVQKIIPYNKRPSEVVIGIPNLYASSLHDGREGFSVTVKTREGRPLFVQGNPSVKGPGLSVRGISQLLNLYDPDRLSTPMINSQDPKKRGNMVSVPRDWESLDQRVVGKIKEKGVHILTGAIHSPSLRSLIQKFSKNTGAKLHFWNPINHSEILTASKLCYGKTLSPKYRYDKAKVIVSVDADFLGTYLNPMESTKLFSVGRDPNKDSMSRLISFQSVTSLTSLNADDNHGIKPSQQLPLILAMIHELGVVQKKVSLDRRILKKIEALASRFETLPVHKEELSRLVTELYENKGQSIVLAGGLPTKTRDALSLQIAVNYLNSLLGNNNKTIEWNKTHGSQSHDRDISELISSMENGEVKTLIINELNPIYNLPSSMAFRKALGKVDLVVATNNWMDETASLADLVAPCGHCMENWGDNEFEPGVITIQQPTIRPLYNTRSFGDSLMVWSKTLGKSITGEENFYSFVKSRFTKEKNGERGWMGFLQKGFTGKNKNSIVQTFQTSSLERLEVSAKESPLELSLYEKAGLHDGTMANVSWLQELPDPVSKITWDNYLMISPVLAKQKNLQDGSVVEVKTDHHKTELPVCISPGLHPGSVAVATGYGRTKGGKLQKDVGFAVSDFITAQGESFIHANLPVEVKNTGRSYDLAQTQGHHNMAGRDLAVETTWKEYKNSGSIDLHKHKVFSIWKEHKYDGHKWAMAVDLNSCTGCSACMLACQSENNIPVVGKKYVLAGREMHWIRLDRYYIGDEKTSVDSIFQPVMCQHCENAPCETVCPVLATVHSDEGLNDMIYNRCVGTRYCSNNCPYKVRRFNWFYYDSHHRREPLHMALNPDVTVRTRGVMEKCTFCVQRIKEAKNKATDENRKLQDGDIQTACQSVCPTESIIFGDLNDKNSKVSQYFEDNRNYTLLEEFNAAPRVRYLGKIRNTHRPPARKHHSTGEHQKSHENHGDHKDETHKNGTHESQPHENQNDNIHSVKQNTEGTNQNHESKTHGKQKDQNSNTESVEQNTEGTNQNHESQPHRKQKDQNGDTNSLKQNTDSEQKSKEDLDSIKKDLHSIEQTKSEEAKKAKPEEAKQGVH